MLKKWAIIWIPRSEYPTHTATCAPRYSCLANHNYYDARLSIMYRCAGHPSLFELDKLWPHLLMTACVFNHGARTKNK